MKQQQSYKDIINALNLQKEHLGISHAVLAKRTDLSLITIKRILSGRGSSAHFGHVLSLAEVLGVDFQAHVMADAESLRRKQAERKAQKLIKLVRGNSALEGQGLSSVSYKRMFEKTVQELLSGPRKKLWQE